MHWITSIGQPLQSPRVPDIDTAITRDQNIDYILACNITQIVHH